MFYFDVIRMDVSAVEAHLCFVLQMQASELVELALSKLEFLEVTKKGLSKLQILLVELEVSF
jgi:hypothetical protein